jgi:hypothetical protein
MTDSRFDEAEGELSRGEPWRYREADAPNPLTIEATGWSTGHTKHGEAEFLNGVDRDGNPWSVLVGSTVLRRRLIEGEVSEWDDERSAYVVTGNEGRVQPGEVVSIKYLGDREGSRGTPYADFAIVRKPPAVPANTSSQDDDIPF